MRTAEGKAVGTLPEHKHSVEEGAVGWKGHIVYFLLLFVCLDEE